MTDYKNIKQEIKPWWVEMPETPTKRQQVAEAVSILAAAITLTAIIFWVAL